MNLGDWWVHLNSWVADVKRLIHQRVELNNIPKFNGCSVLSGIHHALVFSQKSLCWTLKSSSPRFFGAGPGLAFVGIRPPIEFSYVRQIGGYCSWKLKLQILRILSFTTFTRNKYHAFSSKLGTCGDTVIQCHTYTASVGDVECTKGNDEVVDHSEPAIPGPWH